MADRKKDYRKKTYSSSENIANAANEIGKVPPQARDLEEAVLGSMMIDQDSLDESVGTLNIDCFYDPRHKIVFEAISKLYNENKPVDILSVAERMREDGTLDKVGGAQFLAGLTSMIGSGAHMEYHSKILQQKAIQRNLISASYDILRDAFDETVNVDDLISSSQNKMYDAVSTTMKNTYKHVGDVVNRSLDIIAKVQSEGISPGLASGFPSIDAYTSGWKPSNLIIIGARPSVGKTAFALNIARAAAVQFNVPVGFFTLEMHDTEITDRLICAESGIPSDRLHGNRGYKLSADEWSRVEHSISHLVRSEMYIDETPSLPVTEFITKAKKMKHEHNVGLIIIDYLQLMTGPSNTAAYREQEVSTISRMLKATAKELEIPIIALSQLNRNLASRAGSNGRPMLSDLRESGSIEQDADMVLFVHRPAALGLDPNADPAYTEIIIAKNRSGKIGTVEFKYVGDQFRFEEPSNFDFAFEQNHKPQVVEQPQYNPFEGEIPKWPTPGDEWK